MKLKPKTIVFVAPIKTKNPFLDDFIKLAPRTAACPLPNPGKKEVKGAANIDATKGGKRSFLLIDGFEMVCFFILTLEVMLIINELAPNNPLKRGRKGSFTLEWRTAIPKSPDNKKTKIAATFSFSLDIRNIEERISRKGIKKVIVSSSFGKNWKRSMNKGTRI